MTIYQYKTTTHKELVSKRTRTQYDALDQLVVCIYNKGKDINGNRTALIRAHGTYDFKDSMMLVDHCPLRRQQVGCADRLESAHVIMESVGFEGVILQHTADYSNTRTYYGTDNRGRTVKVAMDLDII